MLKSGLTNWCDLWRTKRRWNETVRHPNINDTKNSRDRSGGDRSLLLRSSPDKTTTSEFVLQWGNRKRLRCMKIQVKDDSSGVAVTRTTVRVDRRVIRSDKDSSNQPSNSNGYLNLRQRPLLPQQPPLQRVLRISKTSSASGMTAHQSNGGATWDRGGGAHDEKVTAHHNHHKDNHHNNYKSAASSETAHDSKKGGGSSSGSGEAAAQPMVWPPKFL